MAPSGGDGVAGGKWRDQLKTDATGASAAQVAGHDQRHRFAHWGIRFLAVLLLLELTLGLSGNFPLVHEIPRDAIQAAQGQSVAVPLVPPGRILRYLYDRRSDTNDLPKQSRLRLFENGRELASPHTDHQSIAQKGHGRYSHWGDYLLFSSSDGTDPRTNGRRYTVDWPLNPYPIAAALALLLVVLLVTGKSSGMPEVQAVATRLRHSLAAARQGHAASALRALLHVPVRVARWAVRILCFYVLLVLIVDPGTRWPAQVPIPTAAMTAVSGHHFSVPIDSIRPRVEFFFDDASDSEELPLRSTLRVTENGNPLSLPHASHQPISEQGGGRYSHWGNALAFSSSDGTDPRSNGRVYRAAWTLDVFVLLVPALLLLVFFLCYAEPRRMHETIMLTSGSRKLVESAQRPAIVVRAVILLLLLATAAWATGLFDRRIAVPASAIGHNEGYRYAINILGADPASRDFALHHSYAADDAGFGRSDLTLLENGLPLAHPHTDHQSILTAGQGRYSHWGEWLYFASSDNSDPRTNGRRYELRWQGELHRVLTLPLLVSAFLLWWVRDGVRHVPEAAAIGAALRAPIFWFSVTSLLSAYMLAGFIVGAPPVPIVNYDTGAYFTASHIVPLAYPAFIHGIFALTGSLKAIVLTQLGLFCASVLALQLGLQKLTRSPMFAGIVGCILLMSPALTIYANNLLTEQLFTALLLFHAAAVAWCFASLNRTALLSLAITAALAVWLRPAALFLYGGILFLLMFWHGRRIALLRWCIVPLLILSAANAGLSRVIHGSAPSLAGMALFPHVAHLYQGGGDATPTEQEAMKAVIAPFALERSQIRGLEQQYLWELNNFNRLAHTLYPKIREAGGKNNYQIIELVLDAALHTIRQDPLGYSQVVLTSLYGALLVGPLNTPPMTGTMMKTNYEPVEARDWLYGFLGSRLAARFDADREGGQYALLTTYPIPQLPLPGPDERFVLISAFFACLVFANWRFIANRASPITALTAYVSTLVVGGFLLQALSTILIVRYVQPLDGYVIIAIAAGLWAAGLLVFRRARPLASRLGFWRFTRAKPEPTPGTAAACHSSPSNS